LLGGGGMAGGLGARLARAATPAGVAAFGYAAVVACATAAVVGAALPFRGVQVLAFRAYRFALLLVMAVSALKTHRQFGDPPLRPFSLARIKAWLGPVSDSSDFQYLFIAFLLLAQRPLSLALVPHIVLGLYHVVPFAGGMLKGTSVWEALGAPLHAAMIQRQRQALQLNAASEIALGFAVLLRLLTPSRSIPMAFAYWNCLRMRYRCRDARQYHREIWQLVGARAAPLLANPLAARVSSMAVRWFTYGQA